MLTDLVIKGLRKAIEDSKVSGGSHSLHEKSFRKVIPTLRGILTAGKT